MKEHALLWRIILIDLLQTIKSLSIITFRDVIRDKILYSALLIAFFLLGIGYLAAGLTFIRPERIILNFGLTTVVLTSAFVGIFISANLVGKEIEKRTLHVVLSRPVSRTTFLFGKYFGFIGVLIANWALITGGFLFIFSVVGGSIHPTLLIALFFALLQGAYVGAITLFFSSFSTTTLSIILSIGVYVVGANVSQLKYLSVIAPNQITATFFGIFSRIFPNFESLLMGLEVTYQLPVSNQYFFMTTLYCFMMILFFLFLGGQIFSRREI